MQERKLSIKVDQIASYEEISGDPTSMKTHIITKMTRAVYDDFNRMGIENVTYAVSEDYATVKNLMSSAKKAKGSL